MTARIEYARIAEIAEYLAARIAHAPGRLPRPALVEDAVLEFHCSTRDARHAYYVATTGRTAEYRRLAESLPAEVNLHG
jgi:uncharacterized protein (DUF2336 family)